MESDIVETTEAPALFQVPEDSSCHLQFRVRRYAEDQAFELPLLVLPYQDAQALYMQLNSYLEAQQDYDRDFRKPPSA